MSSNKDKHFWDETRKPWMDLENERRPIRPLKSHKRPSSAKTNQGAANQQLAGFFQDMVMEKAMNDRVAQISRTETPDVNSGKIPVIDLKYAVDVSEASESEHESVDDDLETIRARRLLQLRRENDTKRKMQSLGHGTYTEIVETEFLDSVLKSPRVIVHFYHDDFQRCKAMDKNLSLVAPDVVGIRFLKINAEKCPFFVEKLKIRVLPSLVYFIDGKSVHSVTGFGEFGGTDDFVINRLILSLQEYDMLKNSNESDYSKWLEKDSKNVNNLREDISDSDYMHCESS